MARSNLPYQRQSAELRNALLSCSGAFAAAGVFSFFINILMLTGPLFMLQIYDRVITSRSMPTLIALTVLVAGLFAIMGLLDLVRSRVLVRIGARIDTRLSSRVYEAVMRQSLNPAASPMVGGALRELDTLRQFLTGPGPFALFDAPWVPVYLAVIFLFHWVLGVVALAGGILLFIMALLNEFLSRRPLREANTVAARSGQLAETGRRNAEVIFAMGMLSSARKVWQKYHREAMAKQGQASDRAGGMTTTSKAMRLFLQSAILATGAALAIREEITPGTMIAASIIMGRALQPVEMAIGQWRGFVRARQAYKMLSSLLGATPEQPEKMDLPDPVGKLDVVGVRVGIPGQQKLIIGGVTFSLKPGDVLGLIGPSASGKSTLARALVGIWPLAGGEVRLDGAMMDQWDREKLGRFIGYLPQDVELFGGTVRQNIARFAEDADDEKVIEAAKWAGVHEMILKLPEGYDTILGESGSNLSAGQRQRVALARAIYGDPVLVVLDEPNSNLDAAGDAALIKAVRGMGERGQTVILIAHRPAALAAVDYILVLEGGMQKAFGPRDEILQQLAAARQQAMPQAPQAAPPGPQQAAPPVVTGGPS